MKRILIAGAAGFIGRAFLRHLAEDQTLLKSDRITVLDKLTYAANVSELKVLLANLGAVFHQVDISNLQGLSNVFGEQDLVINFAAESHVDNSILSPGIFASSNYLGTSNLLELSVRRSVGKYVQVSTDEVYGSIAQGEAVEDSPLQPSSPYSASKAAADHLVVAFHKTYGLDYVITRTCNNFGPGQHEEKFIPKALIAVKQNRPVQLYGDGRNVREWIDVRDNVAAIRQIIESEVTNEIFNIGSDERLENRQVLELMFSVAGRGSVEFVEDRKGHDLRYAIDSSKFRKMFKVTPKRTLADYFQEVFSEYSH